MIILTEQIEVNESIEKVFQYVSDFRTIEQWDPAVRESKKTTPGRTGVGTAYRLKLRYGILPVTMTYTILEYREPNRVVLQGRGESFTARDTIDFISLGPKTRIIYQAALKFQGVAASIAPVFRRALENAGKKAVTGLEKAFNRKITAPRLTIARTLLDRTIIGGLPGFTRFGFAAARGCRHPVTASLQGKTVVITGATSGIGLAAAQGLAEKGGRVVIVARNLSKAKAVKHRISTLTGNDDIAIYRADMGIPSQVRQVAMDLAAKEPAIDVLINNAGALYPWRQLTGEGLEKTFATDLLGPFVLTRMLIPKLKAAAPARIINVSSGGMYTQKIHPDDLQFKARPFDGAKAYARAKRGMVILTQHWAEQLRHDGVTVHAMHPGWVKTPGIQTSLPRFYQATKRFLRTPEQGADTIVWLACAPEAAQTTGLFWLDRLPHTTHVSNATRETREERSRLHANLIAHMKKWDL